MPPRKQGLTKEKLKVEPKNIKLKGDHYFKVSIESGITASSVTCWVLNTTTKESATLEFQLHNCDTLMSATVTIPDPEAFQHTWVNKHIDLISPMVCRAVLQSLSK